MNKLLHDQPEPIVKNNKGTRNSVNITDYPRNCDNGSKDKSRQ
jgi:hypothetical protein